MKIPKKKLSPRQLKALDLIMSGKTTQEVAEEVGVTRQTISHWKNHDPEFKERLAQLLAEVDEELRYSAPLRDSLMRSQLFKLASEGPHENRLKAALAYLDRYGAKSAPPQVGTGLNEADGLLLQIMHGRRAAQVDTTTNVVERRQ